MDERLLRRWRRWHFKLHFLTRGSETISVMDAVVHPSISVRSLMRSSVYRSTSRSLHHAILCVLLVHHLPFFHFVPPSASPLPISLHLGLIASFHICISLLSSRSLIIQAYNPSLVHLWCFLFCSFYFISLLFWPKLCFKPLNVSI